MELPLDYDSLIKQAKLVTAKTKSEIAKYQLMMVQMRFRPSLNLPVTVKREGGHWVCTLETSEDVLECPVAYGDSPNQAALNFDHLWLGIAHIMQDAEEIEEQEDEDDEDEDEDDEVDNWSDQMGRQQDDENQDDLEEF